MSALRTLLEDRARVQPEDRVMFGFHSLCSALLGESPIRDQVLWVGLPVFLNEAPHWGSSLFSSPGTGLQVAQGLLPTALPLGTAQRHEAETD